MSFKGSIHQEDVSKKLIEALAQYPYDLWFDEFQLCDLNLVTRWRYCIYLYNYRFVTFSLFCVQFETIKSYQNILTTPNFTMTHISEQGL